MQVVHIGLVLISLFELLHYLPNGIISKFADINVKIYWAGKLLTPLQLEKEYQDWLLQMHDHYGEENNFGADQPIFIISPKNEKSLGISSDGRLWLIRNLTYITLFSILHSLLFIYFVQFLGSFFLFFCCWFVCLPAVSIWWHIIYILFNYSCKGAPSTKEEGFNMEKRSKS